MLLNLRLNAQVETLSAQNAQLAKSNAESRIQLQAVSSARALEEQARRDGYANPNEQVFLIQPTPSAGASISAAGGSAAATNQSARTTRGDSTLWGKIINWWRSVWH